jgi:hypothetical protein
MLDSKNHYLIENIHSGIQSNPKLETNVCQILKRINKQLSKDYALLFLCGIISLASCISLWIIPDDIFELIRIGIVILAILSTNAFVICVSDIQSLRYWKKERLKMLKLMGSKKVIFLE